MSLWSSLVSNAPTIIGAAGGYALSGGNPMGAIAGAGVGSTFQGNVLNQRNFELQQDIQDYQMQLQNSIFGREDNSVQRRVADLKKAGLSPVLAAGSSAGTGGEVRVNTPQHPDYRDPAEFVGTLLRMKQDISQSNAQIELLEKQRELADSQEKKNAAETSRALAEASIKWHDDKLYRKTGTTSNASSTISDIRNLVGIVDKLSEKQSKKLGPAEQAAKDLRENKFKTDDEREKKRQESIKLWSEKFGIDPETGYWK